MLPITSTAALKDAILMLENQQQERLILLKDQINKTIEGLKPVSIIKNTLSQVATPPEMKEGLLNTSIGIAAGYLTEKIMIGNTANPLKKVLGTAIKYAVTNVVTRHPGGIISLGRGILNKVLKNKKAPHGA